MKNCLKVIWEKIPKPDSLSLSWPPSLNFPFRKNEKQHNLQHFLEMVEKASWKKEFINHKEIWICEEDNTFQIEIGDRVGEWREEWTKVYPDINASEYRVNLKINGITIKELTFISCDGGRIFVPLPELESENDKTICIWRRDSLRYKVCQVIGDYYIHENIEGVARMSNIRII